VIRPGADSPPSQPAPALNAQAPDTQTTGTDEGGL